MKIIEKIKYLGRDVVAYTIFLLLLGIYFVKVLTSLMMKFKLPLRPWIRFLDAFMDRLDGKKEGEVSRIYLIEMSIRNLKSKKGRAVVTIGGVAVGVSAIVFLVSLGYGLEKMVISRVARLEELKMIDVGLGEVSTMKMDDRVVDSIGEIPGVEEAIPVVSLVSKVKFKNSVLDIMSLGVDERYVKSVGVKLVAGGPFKTNKEDLSWVPGEIGKVRGASLETITAKAGQAVREGVYRFNLDGDKKLSLRKECSYESEMLGYINRMEGGYVGEELWGERHYQGDQAVVGKNPETGEEFSPWVRTKAPVWVGGSTELTPLLEGERQRWEVGCVLASEILWDDEQVTGYKNLDDYLQSGEELIRDGRVLGISDEILGTTSATLATPSADLFETVVATDSAGIEWVSLKSGGGGTESKPLSFEGIPAGEAFVSLGMLNVFGVDKNKAIGQKFSVSYIIPDGLIPGKNGRLQSKEVEYKVAGVVDDATSNYYYFHLLDIKKLGVRNYSQLKVVMKGQEKAVTIRKAIETMGLRTTSTLDTVAEIEKLFRTLRLVLGFLGMTALAVASLGMFNTMTVSLLERTREVGVMKAMGMLSDDVRELFLAESMIMGVGGGLLGVVMGVLSGKLLSLILSSVSVLRGQGLMDISYVPWFFVTFIVFVSFLVGIATGWYPSKRARQISALNALRYE